MFDAPISPWPLLEGAVAVYTVSSQLGFEAILAGHKPRVFGQPFYAGWGLTQDENPVPTPPAQPDPRATFCCSHDPVPDMVRPLSGRDVRTGNGAGHA